MRSSSRGGGNYVRTPVKVFSLGSPSAESDDLVTTAYFNNGDLSLARDFGDFHRFLVGRTGSGKTALFEELDHLEGKRVIRFSSKTLSLPYALDLPAIQELVGMEVHLEPFFDALWKHVIVVEVIRHRYKVTSPEGQASLIESLTSRLHRDPGKRVALAYFEEFGGSFWCDTDQRVREIVERLDVKLHGAAGAIAPGLGAHLSGERSHSVEVRTEITQRYQRLVNETQLPKLNQVIEILGDLILDSDQHKTYLLIDDLDIDWSDDPVRNLLLRSLLGAVLDLQKVRRLKVIVALRTNIFETVESDTASRHAQGEKHRAAAVHIGWTAPQLEDLLDDRIGVTCQRYGCQVTRLRDLLPSRRRGERAIEYILSRTLMRPRDAIMFLDESLRRNGPPKRVTWGHIEAAEKEYSKERLLALGDEWKDPYVGIDKVFDAFRGAKAVMTPRDIEKRLEDAALLASDACIAKWLLPLCEGMLSGSATSWSSRYVKLIRFLFNLGLLGLVSPSGERAFQYTDSSAADSESAVVRAVGFVIHPAFCLALEVA